MAGYQLLYIYMFEFSLDAVRINKIFSELLVKKMVHEEEKNSKKSPDSKFIKKPG